MQIGSNIPYADCDDFTDNGMLRCAGLYGEFGMNKQNLRFELLSSLVFSGLN